jgi:hypothetical protein
LLAVSSNPLAVLVFPAWVVLISIFLLRYARRGTAPEPDAIEPHDTTHPNVRSDQS